MQVGRLHRASSNFTRTEPSYDLARVFFTQVLVRVDCVLYFGALAALGYEFCTRGKTSCNTDTDRR